MTSHAMVGYVMKFSPKSGYGFYLDGGWSNNLLFGLAPVLAYWAILWVLAGFRER